MSRFCRYFVILHLQSKLKTEQELRKQIERERERESNSKRMSDKESNGE